MQTLQINLSDELLEAYRQYAETHGVPLDDVIQDVLCRGPQGGDKDWLDEYFAVADEAPVGSSGKRWRREDLYDV